MLNEVERALDALYAIPPGLDRETWHRIGRAAIASGLSIEQIDAWSSKGNNYHGTSDVQSSFRTVTAVGGTGPGTLYRIAAEYGWNRYGDRSNRGRRPNANTIGAPAKPRAGMGAVEIWERCEYATNQHPYIEKKSAVGVSLEHLRVVPVGDILTIQGESMVGALVVPVMHPNGALSSLQFITPPETAARLKAKGKTDKPNLPEHRMQGWFTVGELLPGGVAYIVEGIGHAWACWQATGAAAVVAFGAGNMGRVANAIRARDPSARLVLVPDVGKEKQAADIAATVSGKIAVMPEGWETNSDVNDLAQNEGLDVLAAMLEAAIEPIKKEPRYKLLGSTDLQALPPLQWRVGGVLPIVGLAGLFGPSSSGKSFLGFDMAAHIALGSRWFDCRVEAAPVVYAALEGEAGFKLRAQAWEAQKGHALPNGLHMLLQPFKLTDPHDVSDLAAVVPAGAVVFIDTLNRAAPTADENSSRDMGEILEAAKRLQSLIGGLVVLIHHTGKDASKGLRGHSSLSAALDASIQVSRDGDRREWRVAKAKDGAEGGAHLFRLQVVTMGIDVYGEPITSCTVRTDHSSDDVKKVRVPQGGNQRLLYEGIRGMFKDGILGKPGAPPLRPCIALEVAVVAGAARLTCPSDKKTSRARDAITGLVSRGVLGLNDGFLWLV